MKITDFSNASLLTSFRFWLIKKIARGDVIILNAQIGVVWRTDDTTPLIVKNIKGGFIADNCFEQNTTQIVKIQQFAS